MFENWIMIVFVLGYAAIAMEHKIGVNKASAALLTAVACWVLLALQQVNVLGGTLHGIAESLSHHLEGTAQIIFFLIGAMTIVQLMETHGGFQVVTDMLTIKKKRKLLCVVSLITFFLSAVLDNLTTSIVMVSLLHRLVNDRDDRLIFGSMVIIAANAGGAWSPIGDVTTTMLWIGGRVSALRIVEMLFIPSMIAMLVPLAYFALTMKDGEVAPLVRSHEEKQIGTRRVFYLGLGALVLVPIFKGITGLPPFVGILFGLGLLWLVTDITHGNSREHLKVPLALHKIDMSSIMFFLGILLAVSALETAGILKSLALGMDSILANKDIIATELGLVSAIVDNIPITAATMGMYDLATYPMDCKLWELLAFTLGTGGSVLIIGSAAGVVVMGMEKINFLWYLKKVSLPALVGYFAGIGSYLLIYRWIG
ncbi:MAG: sodium:proton antiporter NhaD [Candidatus Omnitrophica bacterium]|nr:sodium:proton antiporter NhaD [Candidatus Omnitrophota bacterium]